MLDEERVSRFAVWEGYHFVEVSSRWTAAYGDLYIGQTKEGGIALRLHYQLETFWGGVLRNSLGAVGEAKVFDEKAAWIEISGQVEGNSVGVVLMPHPAQEQIPWFARDYGVHVYSPCRHAPRRLDAGQTWSQRMAVAAFDGPSDGSQGARAWEIYRGLAGG